ncbi:uncharacterized protein [Amphiura filiformis]|uniref:uncharacterized protein n=1 Tax=Amphiura filiformis TaxID=82378 RepID=UPI003B2152A0
MATPFSEIAKDELSCPLCYELFLDPHNPKDLNCPHVCCQICLKKLVVLTEDRQQLYLDCPECRQKTTIPPGGIVAMKTNIRLRSLAEKHKQHQEELHRASQMPICSEHEGETRHFYCITCKVDICQFCLIQYHQGSHIVQELKNVSKQKRRDMTEALNEAERDTEQREKELRELLELERNLERSLRFEEYKIDNRAEAIVVNIYKKCNELKSELRLREEPRLERIRKERTRTEKMVQEMKDAQTAAEQAKIKKSDHEYIDEHEIILAGIRAFQISDRINISRSDRSTGVTTFEPYPPELLDIKTIKLGRLVRPDEIKDACATSSDASMSSDPSSGGLGREFNQHVNGNGKFAKAKSSKEGRVKLGPFKVPIVKRSKSTSSFDTMTHAAPLSPGSPSTSSPDTSPSASPILRRNREAKLLCQFGNFEIARGITTTADQRSLVIADHSKKAILIYGVVGDELKQTASYALVPDNPNNLWDVAVTPDDKLLVAREISVEVYSNTGHYEGNLLSDPGETGSSEGIRSVATTTYGRVLVGNVVKSTITIYSSSKAIMKVIKVAIPPWHLNSNGKTIACSILRDSKVCVVDIESEQEVLTFHVDGGPRGLLYDEATGSILVSSWERQSIEQYCSTTGAWLGTVADGLNCPDGLIMTSKGRLAVADTTSVKIYRML